MPMNRIRDAPTTIKILLIAIVLILLPGAVLSYVGYNSVNERARQLAAGYRGTLSLVRDKIELEALRLEQGLRSSIENDARDLKSLGASRHLLQLVATNNPWLSRPFLASADGNLIASSISFEPAKPAAGPLIAAPLLREALPTAETAEFVRKDPAGALELYAQALQKARSGEERALLLSRIGRCRFKLGDYESAIQDYKKLLDLSGSVPITGDVPTFILALSQIADGYAAVKDEGSRIATMLQLYRRLVEDPWDSSPGAYEYSMKQTARELEACSAGAGINPPVIDAQQLRALRELEAERIESLKHLQWVQSALLPEIRSGMDRSTIDPSIGHISARRESKSINFGYLRLKVADSSPWVLVFELHEARIIDSLLPRILEPIDLGSEIGVGILDGEGSVRYPQMRPVAQAFLATQNFTGIFPSWKVVLFHPDGRSINELIWREKATYLAFLGGTLLVMILGIFLTVRAAAHEVALSRLKSDFVSNVSHEFKTPLALIRMFGETLETGMVQDEAKRREFYRIIRAESERLTHLINKVLDFSRIDAGVKQYNFADADVVEVIRNTLDTYRFQIRDRGFTIDSQLPSHPLVGRIDPDAVSEALLNLLDNAAKYSGESKYIGVSVDAGESSITVSVEDHGVGIPKEDSPHIFDKFYRGRSQKTRETPGSGLGLTLVKHIVEAHGGHVGVESESGRGSRFFFEIPTRG